MATKKQEQSAESRRRLIDAAARLFASKGFRETTFIDIAAASGISRGSISWHFGSKQGLLLAVVEDLFARDGDREASGVHGLDRLPGFLAQAVERMRSEDGRLLVALLLEALGPHPEIRPAYAAQQRRLRDGIADLLATGSRERSTREAGSLALVVLGALIGMHLQWRIDPDVDLGGGVRALASLLSRDPAR
jgi:TetR/AcrR family acrAB operon transcriptional repressor